MPTANDFREALFQAMQEALHQGTDHLDIEAGELHRRVGGYPGPDHRMPNCCQVMRAEVVPEWGDSILYEPPSAQGASLRIRYKIPRGEFVNDI
jgi:hypothetical protein